MASSSADADMTPAKRARLEPMSTWLDVAPDSDFSVYNLPFGVGRPEGATAARVVSAIGDKVIDLSVLSAEGLFDASYADTFGESTLNAFMSKGRTAWRDARTRLQKLLTGETATLKDSTDLQARVLLPMASVTMGLPAQIGDYTDFYSSREHATNVGTMFRGKDNALQPNWLHLPVGYHGRSSSIVVSGTPVRRPHGQLQQDPTDPSKGSTFGPCRLLDFELEMATFVGVGNAMGTPVPMDSAEDHIFGLCLMNDWSARDIQKWEYVPLGPFTAKNFATTVSPWIITLDALEPFRANTSAGPQQDNPAPLPYLRDPSYSSYDVNLEVALKPSSKDEPHVICRSNFKNLYWNIKQQLVHHTVTGCNMRPGDCLGSGTISGSTPDSYGSLLELSWKGTKPLAMPDGTERKFLKDGDEVVMRGWCQSGNVRVGFGECRGVVLPAATTHPLASDTSASS